MLFAISIFSIFACFLLGLFVFKNNPKHDTNKLFFILTLTIIFWTAANYFSLLPPKNTDPLFWIRLVLFCAIPNASSFLILIHTFPSEKIHIKLYLYYPYLLLSVFLMYLTLSPYIFSTISYKNGSAQPVPGILMPLFALYVLLSIGTGLTILFKKYRSASGLNKLQLSYVLIGTISMFSLILLTIFFPVVILGNSYFVQFSPVYTFPFIAALAYSIIKHRLLDVRLILARTISYTFLLILSSIIYGLLFVFFTMFVIQIKSGTTLLTATTTFTLGLIMSLTFQPIRKLLEKMTDKIFYKDHYDTSKLLYSLTHIMASTLSLSDLTHLLLEEVLREMRIIHGAFILIDQGNIYQITHEGYNNTPEFDEKNIFILQQQNQTLIFDEIPERQDKNIMREYEISITVKLRAEDKEIGLLILGQKLSGDIYSQEDIKLLEILGPEAAVAIENAKSYEEIRRFNITLKEEIDKATKDLQNANIRLKELDQMKNEFVSLASHELRTPMTAIKSYLWLFLEKNKDKMVDKDQMYLERAYDATDRLIKLVNDMLNVSRIEAGRMSLFLKPISMKDIVTEVITELTPTAQKLAVKMILNEPTTALPLAIADPDKIREVLINLIGNSIKFTPPDGTVSISFKQDDSFLTTEIHDTGKGIKQEDLPKLFHKFQTVGNNYLTKMNVQGTGLGLFLTKAIIELHGGKVSAVSDGENKGSTFSFSLKINTDKQSTDQPAALNNENIQPVEVNIPVSVN